MASQPTVADVKVANVKGAKDAVPVLGPKSPENPVFRMMGEFILFLRECEKKTKTLVLATD